MSSPLEKNEMKTALKEISLETAAEQPKIPVEVSPPPSETDSLYSSLFDKTKNWKFTFIILCIVVFIENLIISGSATVVLSTLEKEFFLTSTQSGFFLGVFELGGFLSAPVFGFFGSFKTINKMRLVSMSLFLISVGSLLIGVLVFAKQPYLDFVNNEIDETDNSTQSTRLCTFNETSSRDDAYEFTFLRDIFDNDGSCPIEDVNEEAKISSPLKTSTYDFSIHLEYLLYLGHLIIGFGAVAIYSIGITYIEEIAPPDRSSYCQAIFFGVGSIGGGLGFLVNGQFLNINARFYMGSAYEPNDWITIEHPYWIGAWWIPYLSYGALYTLLFALVFLYSYCSFDPQSRYVNEPIREVSNAAKHSNLTKEKSKLEKVLIVSKNIISQFWARFKKVLKNVKFIFIVLSTITEGIIMKGFLGFMAKYIEYQFQMPASEATVALGIIALVSVILGTLLSAWVINRYKMDGKNCALFTLVIFLTTPFLFLALLNHCPEMQFNSNESLPKCAECNCMNHFNPVCFNRTLRFNDSITNAYQSACHAGCHRLLAKDSFTKCLCIDENLVSTNVTASDLILSNDQCDRSIKCVDKIIVNGVAAFIIVFLTAMSIIPHLKAALGAIDEAELQPLAFGVRAAIVNLFGNFLGTLLVGRAVDSSCRYWQVNCFGNRVCKLYNNYAMSISLAVVGFSARMLSGLFMLVACLMFFYEERRRRNQAAITTTTTLPSSPSDVTVPESTAAHENDIELAKVTKF